VQYLLEAVALVRHFTGSGKIGRAASRLLDSAEKNGDVLVISAVSLMEVLYLAEKNRIGLSLAETLESLELAGTKNTAVVATAC
jgi:predicted nucleic acid-binding protein